MTINEELLTVAAVARRLGVAPATLRTWDRRYGLGPPIHSAGTHRRYCALDLARLILMRRLIATGVSPRDAAETAKKYQGPTSVEAFTYEFEARDDLIAAIFRAAQNFDAAFIETELRKELESSGIVKAWTEVIAPVLILIGKIWEDTGKGIDVEHLFTEATVRILNESSSVVSAPANPHPVLLAAVGNEQHCLALHALAAALAERGIQTRSLGAFTPIEALQEFVARTVPPAIFLWASLEKNALPEFFKELPAVRPAPRILIGGPGWNRDSHEGVILVEDLSEACLEIGRAIGH